MYISTYEQIRKFIVLASQSNIYFSHRVLFFLESLNSEDPLVNEAINSITISLNQTQGNSNNLVSYELNESKIKPEVQNAIELYKKAEMLPERASLDRK